MMVNDFLKMGPHDVGGESSHSIDTHDHGMKYWENFSNGLRMALTSTKIITLDELRLTAESFGQKYFEMEQQECKLGAVPLGKAAKSFSTILQRIIVHFAKHASRLGNL